jgi:hypothetical protein
LAQQAPIYADNPLDQSLAQAAGLLDKSGFALVDDFAFNKIDERTAVWFQGVQNLLAAAGTSASHRIDINEAFANLMHHYSEHSIHTGEELIRVLRTVFRNVEISEGGTYLYRYFVTKMESRPDGNDIIKAIFEWEEFQIEKRFIQGVGLRVVGFK